jgi:hypothetical protein
MTGAGATAARGGPAPAPLLARGPVVAAPGGEEIKPSGLPLGAGRHRLQGWHTFLRLTDMSDAGDCSHCTEEEAGPLSEPESG